MVKGSHLAYGLPIAAGVCLCGIFWLDGVVAALAFPDGVVAVFSVLTVLGDVWTYVVACAALFVLGFRYARLRGFAECLFVAVAVGSLVSRCLKVLFGRARPFVSDEAGVFTLWSYEFAYTSFPSGHSVVAAVFAVALVRFFPALLPVALVVALVVGMSRVALGVHFVSDVVMGWYVGAACGWYVCRRLTGR